MSVVVRLLKYERSVHSGRGVNRMESLKRQPAELASNGCGERGREALARMVVVYFHSTE